VSITLRDTNFQTITRSKSLPDYTYDKTLLMYYIEELVENNYNGQTLRLVGAGFSNFCDEKDGTEEITLFNYQSVYEKEETLSNLISDYKERFGTKSLFFGKDILEKK
jgi:DNA polymerase-4